MEEIRKDMTKVKIKKLIHEINKNLEEINYELNNKTQYDIELDEYNVTKYESKYIEKKHSIKLTIISSEEIR